VAPLATLPLFLAVNASLPVNNFAEFIAYAKANPGLSYASAGIGGSNHLAGEMLRFAAGIDVQHVPYNGSAPALNAVLGGFVKWMFDSGRVIPFAKAGKLKILAVSTLKRLPDFPDVPTIAETYPGFEANGWHGIVAPPRTPKNIVDRLNEVISRAMQAPDVKQTLAAQALIPFIATPEEFTVFIRAETKKWTEVVRRSGAKAE
jgi:tripartite-type tricarboxylate transporter receptor subunit TctC